MFTPRTGRRAVVGSAAALLLLAVTAVAGPAATADSERPPSADPAAVRDWNAIATDTISANVGATRPSGQAAIWHGFVSAAVYNAVVGIQGGYAPYKWRLRGPADASPEAAAVTAAHRVLLTYFPASRTPLDAAYADSLAGIPDGSAKRQGVAFGKRAADHIVELREGDGRFATVEFNAPPAPGVWRPTPPNRLPFIDPWLARLRPMSLDSPAQFRPGAPPALSSARYAQDVNEVKNMGTATGSSRTPLQTETAQFFGGNLIVQFQTALRDHTARHQVGIAETARMFAAVNTSATDAVVTAWDAKLHFGFWRPITAVQLADTDGNPATEADPRWQPLLTTPPHPDYVSGHTTVAAAVTRTLTGLLGTTRIDLDIPSEITGTTRHYEYADRLNRDMINARVWAGIHSRAADLAGCHAGHRVGAWILTHHFHSKRPPHPQILLHPTCPRGTTN
ncbi:vanadium-dependent haloperoxidase [Streptomyces sp. NPDC102274]|uniref:vanadium-dependent haloperoxidase n=1 Tax=Streptomyces sp. NPDC102274 TaxID=3366151 RepID=UPI0037F89C84